LLAPLTCYVHSDCAHGPESPVEFRVNGKLIARGSASNVARFDYVDDDTSIGCSGEVSGHWGGFVFKSAAACTLEYCEIRNAVRGVYDSLTPMVLGHVTVDNAIQEPSVMILDSGMQSEILNSTVRGGLLLAGGNVIIDSSSVTFADTAVYARECTITVANSTIDGFTHEGIRIDSGSVATVRKTTVRRLTSSGTGVVFDGGTGTVDSCSWSDLRCTAATVDPGSSGTVTFRNWVVDDLYKGVVALSGTTVFDSCTINRTAYTGIDASSGNAEIVMDSCYLRVKRNHPAAAVSIGPNARVVANKCAIDSSYIGFEIKGDRADIISCCNLSGNELYGIWFDGGDSTDYSSDNVIEGAGQSSSVGLYVLQQSIISEGDVIYGGYNWNFNINTYLTSGKTADIADLTVYGQDGDDWGLVLNGISSLNDTAWVTDTRVDSVFTYAHLYVRQIHAEMTDCHFVSTDDSTASDYGALVKEGNTGYIGCTEFVGQDRCVERQSAASYICWSDSTHEDAGYNTFATSLTLLYANLATDTVDARNCYWGETPPGNNVYGHVLRNPYLDSAGCGMGEPLAKMSNVVAALPERFELDQNYPNPFNPATTIRFALPIDQSVRIEIYNVLGRRVRLFDLGVLPAGYGTVKWDGTLSTGQRVGSGIYLYRIATPEFTDTKKMLLLK